ncbi:MAG: TipAS antibiotic-recognition domain-containing protein [Clostridia bacterium]|nr:TipAS antibiotic-recognition domain-containing protein [Clostridia bacterium]
MSKSSKTKLKEGKTSNNVFDNPVYYDTSKIANKWGDNRISESNRNWENMTKEEQKAVLQECSDIFVGLSDYIGTDPKQNGVTELMIRWHNFIRNFYDPSLEVLRCLGLMYVYDPDFSTKFEEINPDLPDFLGKAINSYVEVLEDKWLEQQCNVLEE